jgi:hypothetical protein
MSLIKPIVAAGALALAAAPNLADAHGGGVHFGIYLGGPGYAEPYYGYPGWYGPAYYPTYYHRYYYPRYVYRRHYIHYYHPRTRYTYHRLSWSRAFNPCHWTTRRYYEPNGDYVIRREHSCH